MFCFTANLVFGFGEYNIGKGHNEFTDIHGGRSIHIYSSKVVMNGGDSVGGGDDGDGLPNLSNRDLIKGVSLALMNLQNSS